MMDEVIEEVIDTENVDTVETEVEVPALEAETAIEAEEYVPNYSYKIKDDELEFDEAIRSAITSKDAEEHLRDLYTKAGGLDTYKTKLTEKEQTLQDYQTKISSLTDGFNTMKTFRDNGDYRKLFATVGLKEEQVLEYALKIAEEAELPEEQKTIINENRQYQDKMDEYQRKMDTYENRIKTFEETQTQAKINQGLEQLNGLIDTDTSLNSFLTEKGISLRDEVIQYGVNVFNTTSKEIPLRDAYDAVKNKYAQLIPSQEENVASIIKNRTKSLPKISGSNQAAPNERMTFDKLKAMSNKIQFD